MHPVMDALSLITPYDIEVPKIRVGPNTDGGYVMADLITPDQTVLSYGIYVEYRFDAELASRGHRVLMFDHTIDGIDKTSDRMEWHREGVAATTKAAEHLYTIEDHLRRYDVQGENLILKLDVEGCEFDVLDAMPIHVLERFDQIALEIHGVSHLPEPDFRAMWTRVFTKINTVFTLFHVHGNNCDGAGELGPIEGFPISVLMELSYIKTSRVQRTLSRTLYPTPLDFPSVAHYGEKLLRFFPFLPAG